MKKTRMRMAAVVAAVMLPSFSAALFAAENDGGASAWEKFKRGTKLAGEAIAEGTRNTADKVAKGSKKAAHAVAEGYDDAKEYVKEKLEPDNVVGVVGGDGVMDYGSPVVAQSLLDPHRLRIDYHSKDPEYGYVVEKPVMVGNGGDIRNGPLYERRFLDALAGPNGEALTYKRRGSGHHFRTMNNPLTPGDGEGQGLLDIYEVSWPGLEAPIVIYINMYDSDTLKAPVGFTIKPK